MQRLLDTPTHAVDYITNEIQLLTACVAIPPGWQHAFPASRWIPEKTTYKEKSPAIFRSTGLYENENRFSNQEASFKNEKQDSENTHMQKEKAMNNNLHLDPEIWLETPKHPRAEG